MACARRCRRWSGRRRCTSTASSSRRSPPPAGSGTMCETYHGVVDNIDYKTIRYPGHMDLMNFFFHELLMRDRRQLAGEILTHAKPPVDDDVVFVHVAVRGPGERHSSAGTSTCARSGPSRWPACGVPPSPGPPPVRRRPSSRWCAPAPCRAAASSSRSRSRSTPFLAHPHRRSSSPELEFRVPPACTRNFSSGGGCQPNCTPWARGSALE